MYAYYSFLKNQILKKELINKLNKIIVSLKVVFEVKIAFIQF